jgi:hypothetical protein
VESTSPRQSTVSVEFHHGGAWWFPSVDKDGTWWNIHKWTSTYGIHLCKLSDEGQGFERAVSFIVGCLNIGQPKVSQARMLTACTVHEFQLWVGCTVHA